MFAREDRNVAYPEQLPTPMLLFQDPNKLCNTMRGKEFESAQAAPFKAIAK